MNKTKHIVGIIVVLAIQIVWLNGAEKFRVATYNLENYIDNPASNRPIKSEPAKAKIVESILAIKPDVLAIQEIGSEKLMNELWERLAKEGLDFPHREFVIGWDTNIFVAILSRFPITQRRSHTNESYLLYGRRYYMSRGIGEVDIKVNDHYSFTLFTAHLKSKRAIPDVNETEMRIQEAQILREKIDARLKADPNANLVFAGDLNDTKDAQSTRIVIGRGNTLTGLVDTRPAERNGDNLPPDRPTYDPRNITWTHFYGKEDTYSRIDYILISRGMAREWVTNETYVLAIPNWGLASDHRPIVATFIAEDK